ncbi:hypothetical protein [Salinactinospora qingdaonensis]|uniref:Uncharacterized protein n=1 Tax=Salinactinospora qingdaonensis TaxID=702744 RepID=A0ABP7F6V5_9ACTN
MTDQAHERDPAPRPAPDSSAPGEVIPFPGAALDPTPTGGAVEATADTARLVADRVTALWFHLRAAGGWRAATIAAHGAACVPVGTGRLVATARLDALLAAF